MKTFLEVLQEAEDTQSKLNFIKDPNSSTRSIANMASKSQDPIVQKAAKEELQRRRDNGDQEAGAAEPNQDPTMHSADTSVSGEQPQQDSAPVKKKGSLGKEILKRISSGKTISGDAPNEIKLNPEYILRSDGLKEAAMKSVVFSFGRMNPPTVGHEKLVDKIQAVARANKADAKLFLSRTEGDDKNPLPYKEKIKLAKMAFPGVVQDTPAGIYPAGFIGLLKMLEDKYDKVTIVVGSDRLPNIKALANKYNGSEYKFEEIQVVSAGERDPDEEGVGGMSASKMRAAAMAGDLAKFKSGLPARLKSAAKLVMDKLQSYLSEDLDEAVLSTSQRLKRRAQMRRSKGKIRMGQRRALRRKANTKQISRRSRRIAIRMMRKRILRGRNYNDISLSARQAVDRQVARRKAVIGRIAKRIEPKLRRSEAGRKSGAGYASISLSSQKKKKLKEGMSHDNLIGCVNAIMKRIISEQSYAVTPLEVASLVKKSNDTGVPVKVIKEVYNRGVASWNMGLREDTTPQQWGFARVNSFLAGGFNAYTADRDLLEADDAGKHETLAMIADKETTSKSLRNFLRNQDKEIADAAQKELEKRRGQGDKDAGKAMDSHDQESAAAQAEQPAGQVDMTSTPKFSVGAAATIIKSIKSYDELSKKGDPKSMEKAVNQSSEADYIDSEKEEDLKKATPRSAPPKKSAPVKKQPLDITASFKTNKIKEHTEKLQQAVEQVQDQDKDTKKRVELLAKHWNEFVSAKSSSEQVAAVKKLAEYGLIEGHMGGEKIYLSPLTTLDRKYMSGASGNEVTKRMNRIIQSEGIQIPMRGSSSDRVLADLSGKHNEAGVTAELFPSEENKKALNEVSDRYKSAGGDVRVSDKQNKDAADSVRSSIEKQFPGHKIVDCQQVGGAGKTALNALGIDPKTDPTDVIVKIKDKKGKEHVLKYSLKVYTDPNNITMKNSGTKNAGEIYLGEEGKKIDKKFVELKSKYPFGKNVSEKEATENKKNLKQEYLGHFSKTMAKLAKTKEGQDTLEKMWKDVHGCGKNVNTLITNKTTGQSVVKDENYYCSPKRPLEVTYDGVKVVVNVSDRKDTVMQIDLKTESDGSAKLLFRHITKKVKQQNEESFLSFGDFLEESADKAVGNVPVINAKPIHHKASSHKYHIHHMMDPNVALKHQVKDFSKRLDKDVDSDIDQFDKPSSKLPDEVSVPTKKSTAQFFAKYKKEREHIHAGEPVDEQKVTPQYTGDENSWYHDASGQKVQVYSQSDLKHPEDVAKYLQSPTPEKDIGKMMSMDDFLKTQPEKKK
jgi:hypothetical protein